MMHIRDVWLNIMRWQLGNRWQSHCSEYRKCPKVHFFRDLKVALPSTISTLPRKRQSPCLSLLPTEMSNSQFSNRVYTVIEISAMAARKFRHKCETLSLRHWWLNWFERQRIWNIRSEICYCLSMELVALNRKKFTSEWVSYKWRKRKRRAKFGIFAWRFFS